MQLDCHKAVKCRHLDFRLAKVTRLQPHLWYFKPLCIYDAAKLFCGDILSDFLSSHKCQSQRAYVMERARERESEREWLRQRDELITIVTFKYTLDIEYRHLRRNGSRDRVDEIIGASDSWHNWQLTFLRLALKITFLRWMVSKLIIECSRTF